MKSTLVLLMALLMIFGTYTTALADLDLDPVREASNVYTIDVSSDGEAAFIESRLSTQDRSFVHKYESENLYSSTQFDILIVDYLKTSAYPVMRLWITYSADDAFMNITSASFIIGNKKYTFSGIADSDWYQQDDRGYIEQVLIKFGIDNLEFLVALEDMFNDSDSVVETAKNSTCKMILHGRENIEVDLGSSFFLDFLAIKMAMVNIGGLDYMDKALSSTMKITDIE